MVNTLMKTFRFRVVGFLPTFLLLKLTFSLSKTSRYMLPILALFGNARLPSQRFKKNVMNELFG